MDLKEALRLVDGIKSALAALAAAGSSQSDLLWRNHEALGVVLSAARDSHVAQLVAATNATTARALEVADPLKTEHLFAGRSGGRCYLCDRIRADPLHDTEPKSTATPDIHPNRGTHP